MALPGDEQITIPKSKIDEYLNQMPPWVKAWWPYILVAVTAMAAAAGIGIKEIAAPSTPVVVKEPTPVPIADDIDKQLLAGQAKVEAGLSALVVESRSGTKQIVEAIMATPKPKPDEPPDVTPSANPIKVKDVIEAAVGKMTRAKITAPSALTFLVFPPSRAEEVDADEHWIRVMPQSDGEWWIVCLCDVKGAVITHVITVKAGKGPQPPPDPKPVVTPILGDGFRVLLIFDANQTLTQEQQLQRDAKSVRDYLVAKTMPTADGSKRGWYALDKNVDVSNDSPIWQSAMKRPMTQIPWAIISSRKGNYEGPWPSGGVNGMLELLKKYGD